MQRHIQENSSQLMENAKDEDTAASFSWWQDSHNRPPQSPWLRATLSDLDEKTKLMLSIIDQDDGDSFTRRAETFYRRRPELLDTIQGLHKSYSSLALRYKHFQNSQLASSLALGYELKPSAEGTESDNNGTWDDFRLRVLKLTQDNLYRQTELMRSNDQNRRAVHHFFSRLNRLMDEHRDFKTFLQNHPR